MDGSWEMEAGSTIRHLIIGNHYNSMSTQGKNLIIPSTITSSFPHPTFLLPYSYPQKKPEDFSSGSR